MLLSEHQRSCMYSYVFRELIPRTSAPSGGRCGHVWDDQVGGKDRSQDQKRTAGAFGVFPCPGVLNPARLRPRLRQGGGGGVSGRLSLTSVYSGVGMFFRRRRRSRWLLSPALSFGVVEVDRDKLGGREERVARVVHAVGTCPCLLQTLNFVVPFSRRHPASLITHPSLNPYRKNYPAGTIFQHC